MLAPESTGSRTQSTRPTPRRTSASCMGGSWQASIRHNRCAESISSRKTGNRGPFSIPSLEDKIVQKGVVDRMNAIYEQDFLDCSYGFRPGRSQHQALDDVRRVICTRPTGWILELDIQSYFDKIVRGILIEMVEKRVSDGSVLRLIQKWIKVGVIEDGKLLTRNFPRSGTTVGAVSGCDYCVWRHRSVLRVRGRVFCGHSSTPDAPA